jgi:hypothetical protein
MSFLPSRTRVFLCLAHTDMRNYAEYRIMRSEATGFSSFAAPATSLIGIIRLSSPLRQLRRKRRIHASANLSGYSSSQALDVGSPW